VAIRHIGVWRFGASYSGEAMPSEDGRRKAMCAHLLVELLEPGGNDE